MKKTLLIAMLLALCGVQAHAVAVGSRGGKKAGVRRADPSGNPILFGDDVAWKVFESTSVGPIQVVDEIGFAPKAGIIRQICISTGATTVWAVVYDTNTASAATAYFTTGVKVAPALFAGTTTQLCTPILNALFTAGMAVELQAALPGGGVYIYWRELGGYK